jgi:hypothetical protein
VQGRGTEEMKTNDVTNIFQKGKIGFSIELGRPAGGAYLRDLEKVTRKVASMNVEFAEDNPVMQLMQDRSTGALRAEVLDERVLSAIAEFIVPEENALAFIDEMKRFLNSEIDCLVTMSVIARAGPDGQSDFLQTLQGKGVPTYPNGKVNIGMALVTEE